jgi:hypothetical protein
MNTIDYDTDDLRGPRIPRAITPTSDSESTPSAVVEIPDVREVVVSMGETELGRPEYETTKPTTPASPVAPGYPFPVPVSARLRGSPSRVEITFDKPIATPAFPDDLGAQFSVTVQGGALGPYTGTTVASVVGSMITVSLTPAFPGSLPLTGWGVSFVAGPVSLLTTSGYPAAPFTNFTPEVV